MKLNDIMILLNAGYTKQEIDAMDVSETAPTEQIQLNLNTPEPQPEPTAETVQNEPDQPDQKYMELENKLNQLLGIVQAGNLNKGIDTDNRRTAQDALASVIAPPRKERK